MTMVIGVLLVVVSVFAAANITSGTWVLLFIPSFIGGLLIGKAQLDKETHGQET